MSLFAGGLCVVGLVIIQMEGVNMMEMSQLLDSDADGKEALQPTASWTHCEPLHA